MSAMHDDFRAMAASLPRRSIPAPVFKPVAVARETGSYGRMRCLLCDDESERTVCGRCSDHLAKNGGLL